MFQRGVETPEKSGGGAVEIRQTTQRTNLVWGLCSWTRLSRVCPLCYLRSYARSCRSSLLISSC